MGIQHRPNRTVPMAPTTGTVRPCPVCLRTRLLLLLITLVKCTQVPCVCPAARALITRSGTCWAAAFTASFPAVDRTGCGNSSRFSRCTAAGGRQTVRAGVVPNPFPTCLRVFMVWCVVFLWCGSGGKASYGTQTELALYLQGFRLRV